MSDPYILNAGGLGVSSEEAKLAIRECNGIVLNLSAPDPAMYLAGSLVAAAQVAAEDHEHFGFNLTFLSGNCAHSVQDILDLADKVSSMTPQQAATLMGYITGFWDGIGTADRQ